MNAPARRTAARSVAIDVSIVAGERLSADAFRVVLCEKGWTIRALALYWGLSREHVQRIAANDDRSMWWDDALRGLPAVGAPRSMRRASGVMAREVRARQPSGRGFRYHGYMVVGAIVVVSKYLGDDADEGARGVVLHVESQREHEFYTVLFRSGMVERFSPDQVDEYLVTTGLEREDLRSYAWRGAAAALADLERGLIELDS